MFIECYTKSYVSPVDIMRTKIIGRGMDLNGKTVWNLCKYKLEI